MKTTVCTSMALLALAQLISAAPSALERPADPQANTTFVLASVVNQFPKNIAVDASSELYIQQQNGPPQEQQRFMYDTRPDRLCWAGRLLGSDQ